MTSRSSRGSEEPEKVVALGRSINEGELIRELHQGQRSCGPQYKAGHMAYVDGPRLARVLNSVLIGSLAVICPASGMAVTHDRGPRWLPQRKFLTAWRPVTASGRSGVSCVSDRSITPSARFLASSSSSAWEQDWPAPVSGLISKLHAPVPAGKIEVDRPHP
jgi:hypothetical protein